VNCIQPTSITVDADRGHVYVSCLGRAGNAVVRAWLRRRAIDELIRSDPFGTTGGYITSTQGVYMIQWILGFDNCATPSYVHMLSSRSGASGTTYRKLYVSCGVDGILALDETSIDGQSYQVLLSSQQCVAPGPIALATDTSTVYATCHSGSS